MQEIINDVWKNRTRLNEKEVIETIEEIIRLVDAGKLRVAEKDSDGKWSTNDWIKKAIIMYFPLRKMEISESGIFQYHDKMMLKRNFDKAGVRVVPPATVRYGAFIAAGAILMPSYVNIGAYVDSGTMVDTWATVGSCAQIGKDVHLSGGVGIGGVLEPAQAAPVIIEDGAFIGSRCIVVEGAFISKRAVLGAGVTITGSSKIIDVTGPEPVVYKGFVPEDSVVIPGTTTKSFPAGDFQVPCALIIGKRKASTDLKTSLNDALRENDLVV
ncbi:MAG: 2,3,4,5-tetrahydropyridine-2-carboxylate N-succinyltransferase [Spirosomataceae bacterium]|jgi:2,3,4,5-tetrahydropyridine-2-carboxylate N-succinyltransferase